MKKSNAITAVLAILLFLLCGCASPGDSLDSLLCKKGLNLASRMDMMAESKEYISLLTASKDLDDIINEIGAGQYAEPTAIYKVNIPNTALVSMFSEYEGEELPEELKSEVEKRLISAFPSRINGLNGPTVIAAASMLNSSDVFIGKGLTNYLIYIYIFEAGTPISVTFIPGSENIVSANSSFIINDTLKEIESETDLKEWLRENANLSDCEVSEVQVPNI